LTLFELGENEASGPAGPLVRVRLLVAYDGTDFAGVAPNPGVKTVGGQLMTSIERVLRHPVKLTVAGRTDAGVHAWGQVVTFDAQADGLDLAGLVRSVNRMCAPAIVVREATVEADDFDARHSAIARRYRYTIVNRPVADPFLRHTAWHVEHPLDLATMRLACDPLFGEHDFASFCRKPKVPEGVAWTHVRRVLDARWHDLGEGILRFDIDATAFCQQMVRSIVGTLVDVGLGKKRAGDMRGIILGQDRALAGAPAPAHGLVLWEVVYPPPAAGPVTE
jgi:tRNA pseudouridine38-40 synthase